jgi:hypothetical protein
VNDRGEELGVEGEESLNLFRLSSLVDVDVDCIGFPTTKEFDMVT